MNLDIELPTSETKKQENFESSSLLNLKTWFFEQLRSLLVTLKILKQRRREREKKEREQLQNILDFELDDEHHHVFN